MASTTKVEQAARVKARARRIALDKDRAARDARIEDVAAAVFAALADRSEAEHAIEVADEHVARGLRRLLDEGLSTGQAVELCELTPGVAQKLLRRHTSQRIAAEPRQVAAGAENPAPYRRAAGVGGPQRGGITDD